MTPFERWTLTVRLATLLVLASILVMLGVALPVLVHAAHIYITMYG